MATRTPDRIFDAIMTKQGKSAKVYRKMAINKERNWFLALTLNSFAKLGQTAQEVPLSDVEQLIVDAYRKQGFSDAQLIQQGRFYEQLSSSTRAELFPGTFAQLTPRTPYALRNLRQDAPGIVQAILSMRNVTNIDVPAIHAGRALESDYPLPRRDVIRAHAGAMLLALEPNPPVSPQLAPASFSIKATGFHCTDESGWDWTGADEPYWIFGSVGADAQVTTKSRVFENALAVNSGDDRTFNADEGLIWGPHGMPQPIPDGEVGSLVQLWENDYGNPAAVMATVGAAFAAASTVLLAAGVTAWIGAVVAGVGGVVTWLVSFIGDDHIADHTFVFTRQTLTQQLQKAGGSFDMTRRCTDEDADYTIKIKVSRVS